VTDGADHLDRRLQRAAATLGRASSLRDRSVDQLNVVRVIGAPVQGHCLSDRLLHQIRTPPPPEESFLELSAVDAQPAQRERGLGKKGCVLTNLLGSIDKARKDQTLRPSLSEVRPHRSQISRSNAMPWERGLR
jgi:hypothetical protein